jgi:hypothetical protein
MKAYEITYDYRILRAIIFYFPIENSTYFQPEFKWMYRQCFLKKIMIYLKKLFFF